MNAVTKVSPFSAAPPGGDHGPAYARWWRHLFEESEEAQLVCARDGRVIEVNRRASQMLGLTTRASLFGCNLFAPDTLARLRELLARPNGHAESISAVNLSVGDAVSLVADICVTPLDAACSLVTVRDASRRWRLENHAQRLLSAVDATPEVVWLADAQLQITFVNPAFHSATGYTIEESLGRTPEFLRAPAEQQKVSVAIERIRSGADWAGEFVNRRADGSEYPVEVTITPILDQKGRFIGCAAFERDVTAKKQLQAELLLERNFVGSIINSLDSCLYTIDGKLRLTHFNEGWRRLPAEHGWLRLAEPPQAGRSLLDYVPDQARRAELERLCRSVLAEGQPQEIRTVADDGRHWVINIVPWQHEGQMRGLIYRVTDNTSFVGIQNQLLQAQKMEIVGALAAGVAHDFNNLLLAVRGNVGLVLMDEQLQPGFRARLDQVDQAAARASDLSQQLLTFSRVAEEKVVVLDFNQVLRDTSELAKRTLRARVSLELHPAEAPVKVQLDATRAQQVLLNLCINAADAMPKGGRLTITNQETALTAAQAGKTRQAPGTPFLRCSVADTGTGIPPEILPRIFSPFFTTKPKGKGTGLGLAIVHDVVAAAGGFVEVESTVGQGTVFHVCLPLDQGPLTQKPAEPAPNLNQGSGRVLVVDDLDLVLEFAARFLREAGYEVVTATDAETALQALEENGGRFDLVLTDYTMPGRSGWQFIQEAAARWPALRFVLASGYIEEEERGQINGAPHVRIISKPYSMAEATAVMVEMMEAGAEAKR